MFLSTHVFVHHVGIEPPPKQIPATLENTRVPDDTIVRMVDTEVLQDEATDEFHEYFTKGKVGNTMFVVVLYAASFVFGADSPPQIDFPSDLCVGRPLKL